MEIRDNLSVNLSGQPHPSGIKKKSPDASDAPITDSFKTQQPPQMMQNLSAGIASEMVLNKDFSTLVWKAPLRCHFTANPVIGEDGSAFIGSDNGTVTRFNISTGKEDWVYYHKGSKKMSDPIMNDRGELVVLADLHDIHIIDSRSGEKLHELETDKFTPSAPTWGPDGALVFMSIPDGVFNKTGSVYALDPGQKVKKSFLKRLSPLYRGDFAAKLWEVPLKVKGFMDLSMVNPSGKPRNALLQGDMLFFSDGEEKIVALDGRNGKMAWQYPAKSDRLFDPFTIDKNTIGMATGDTITAIDAKTGKKQWSANCGNIIGAPASDGHGTVFYRRDFSTFVAVENGKEKWSKSLGFSPTLVSPATDRFGGVYVVTEEGGKATISALDGSTGDLRFKLSCSGSPDSPPVVTKEGRILVKMREGDRTYLCCFSSPFDPDISRSIPQANSPEIEEGEGWVRIGGIRLDVKEDR